jgi:hypothetical protein
LNPRRIELQPDPIARGGQFDNLFLVERFAISPVIPRFIYAKERMQIDSTYRPGTLIIDGSRRGVKRSPEKYGIGEWENLQAYVESVDSTNHRYLISVSSFWWRAYCGKLIIMCPRSHQ